MTTNHKTISGIKFQTTPIGALRQMMLLPTVLRVMSGPFGILLDQISGNMGVIAPLIAKAAESKRKAKAGDTFDSGISLDDLKSLELKIDAKVIQAAMKGLADEIAEGQNDLRALLADTFAQTKAGMVCLDDDNHFDEVFNGKMFVLIQVVIWVGKVNFADFLNSDTQTAKVSETPQQKNGRSPRALKA